MFEKKQKNGTMMQYFEWYLPADHTLWKKLAAEAPRLAEMGITSIWAPPATKGAYGDQGVGYALYDLYDLGEFDQKGSIPTKYGTKQEYIDAIKACHKAGIEVYADTVLDHKIGADACQDVEAEEVSYTDRDLPTSGEEDIKAWTVFNFPGRHGKYSDFTWDASCFDGTDWDDGRKKNAIYLFKGHNWDTEVDSENGNYDYLMGADIDYSNPKVTQELSRWGHWFLDTTGVDGLRMDACKHIDARFMRDWVNDMRTYARKDLFVVGEYWHPERNMLENYLSEVDGAMSLFDVPLHYNFFQASNDGFNYDMSRILDDALASENPVKAVTFVDNHDTQPGQALQSWVQDWFRPLAYAIILLRMNGYPCVFYGDCYGMPHDQKPALRELPALLALRRDYAYGPQHDYFDDRHIIGWTREDSGMAVILSAHMDGHKRMFVGTDFAGHIYREVLGNHAGEVMIGQDGWGDFPVTDGRVCVWLDKEKPVDV